MEAGRSGERDGEQRVMAPPVGRRSAVRATRPKTSKSFLRGKSLKGKCRLSLSAMGSGGWHDQKKHLTPAGLLMEAATGRERNKPRVAAEHDSSATRAQFGKLSPMKPATYDATPHTMQMWVPHRLTDRPNCEVPTSASCVVSHRMLLV